MYAVVTSGNTVEYIVLVFGYHIAFDTQGSPFLFLYQTNIRNPIRNNHMHHLV